MVDGAPSTAVYRPLVHQDATYVPLRPVAELFESEVGWDGDRSKASVIDGEREGFVYVWRNHPASRISGVFRDGWRLQADTFKRRADREQGATVTIDRVDDYRPYILVAAWNRRGRRPTATLCQRHLRAAQSAAVPTSSTSRRRRAASMT